MNTVFLYISQLASILGEKKSGDNGCKTDVAALVEKSGELSKYFMEDFISIVHF